MKVLLAASEVVGFAKTGGLADVAGSLPRALADRGHECAVILPLYRCTRATKGLEPTEVVFPVAVGTRSLPARIWQGRLPDSPVTAYLIEQPEYFDRDDARQGRGLYQFTQPDGSKRDYEDNCARFVFFCRAVLEALPRLGFWPDVLHANDWQTGLLPVYLRELYRKLGDFDLRARYAAVRTLFTIHNIAYQGVFPHVDLPLTGLDWKLYNYRQLEFFGKLNCLKAGIVFTDLINTVSPTYAREIQTVYYGAGLQGVLMERNRDLFGIMNGADYQVWNPTTDPNIPACYDAETVAAKKPLCKAALQRAYRLPERPEVLLLGMVARLVDQKGLDILLPALPEILRLKTQVVILGDGDPKYHRLLSALAQSHPDQIGLRLGYDEALAHQIEAGADAFLMPSLFEPSGLNQLYSLKYGTPPIVRATGGLADTVTDYSATALTDGSATGFRFVAYGSAALQQAVRRAYDVFRNRSEDWLRLMRNGMRQDWSWTRSACEYEKVYASLAARRSTGV